MTKRIYIILIICIAAVAMLGKSPSTKMEKSYTNNPNLKTVNNNPDWKGTPINSKGEFQNIYHPMTTGLKDVFKWQFSKNPQKKEKKSETRKLKTDFDSTLFKGNSDFLIFLGHATFLIRINGTVFITDPFLMDNFFLKRESKLPFPLEKLPKIDYLLLSHNHRDHCDKNSIKFLVERNPTLEILTGLGVTKDINNWLNQNTVQEAGWYQNYKINNNIAITYVPSRHWSKRGLFDDNKSLWGGFYIKYNENKSLYFMGDSGETPVFEDIANVLGKPKICIMGIGAYKPEWFMHQAHISPLNAIKAFNKMEGKILIPMHFGTFDLSDEPRMEPWQIIEENKEKINGLLVEPVLGKNLLLY